MKPGIRAFWAFRCARYSFLVLPGKIAVESERVNTIVMAEELVDMHDLLGDANEEREEAGSLGCASE